MMRANDNKVTILVNSCDKYEDAWEPFFRLLKIQWPECEKYRIVLSTESKTYNCDFLDIETINIKESISWSARLQKTLEKIETEYVLFFLEDFFLLEKVRTKIFDKALELLESDGKIGVITFGKKRYGAQFPLKTDYKNCFYEVPKNKEGRTNVLVSLWRKDYFIKLIYNDENPWEYEKNSNIRSKFAGYKVYSQDYRNSPPAFRYCMNPADGYGITQGKWLCNNQKLFESYGIFGVNYERLGVFEGETSYDKIQEKGRKSNAYRKEEKRQALKKEKYLVRMKEHLYDLYKYIKKSDFVKRAEYLKMCFKYFFYYKFN